MNLFSLVTYYKYFLAIQKCHKDGDYTIHGLWIDYYNRSYPEFCNNTPFKLHDLDTLRDDLNVKWRSCWGDSVQLWKHEWDKHGTCFYPKMNVSYYFSRTLELFDKHKAHTKCNDHQCLIEIDYIEI